MGKWNSKRIYKDPDWATKGPSKVMAKTFGKGVLCQTEDWTAWNDPTKDAVKFEEEVRAIIAMDNQTTREIEEILCRCLKFKWNQCKGGRNSDAVRANRADQLTSVFDHVKTTYPKDTDGQKIHSTMMKADESFEDYQERMEKSFLQHPGLAPDQEPYVSLLCHAKEDHYMHWVGDKEPC